MKLYIRGEATECAIIDQSWGGSLVFVMKVLYFRGFIGGLNSIISAPCMNKAYLQKYS